MYSAELPAAEVRWLWKNHFALGKLSVVAGPANVGKSLLVAGDLASRVSAGAGWPGSGAGCPAEEVAIVGRRVNVADVLRPRLVSHGADLGRVHFVGPFAPADGMGWLPGMPPAVTALIGAMRFGHPGSRRRRRRRGRRR